MNTSVSPQTCAIDATNAVGQIVGTSLLFVSTAGREAGSSESAFAFTHPLRPSSKELRRQLERVVLSAREEAERGAAAALESFGVAEAKAPGHLDEAGKVLRRKLRAHGRQVGDVRRTDDSQEVKHLVHECAYEHWHRMLFARFLAENRFLIEPESGLDVDFLYCEDEGKRLGVDPWEVAAGFAQKMLLNVFRSDSPNLQLRLPRETRNDLTALLGSLPREVFLASDSLGWVYQFWQAKKKDEVNESGVKIGADELSPVTQLFTEDYMVDFLLDNTLGAWWAGKVLVVNPTLAETASSEDELRQAVSLPGCPWKYLRFVRGKVEAASSRSPDEQKRQDAASTLWTPAAGTFVGWPKSAKELKCLDPCMGSGHFVVAMFERLVALRMAEEKLDEKATVAAVIRDNLFGLELDPRCTQIGAFNLALAAWRHVGHCALPAMNLACSGLAPNTREADWLAIVDAASSRTSKSRGERQDAAATFAPINYFRPDEPVANLSGNLPHWRQEGTSYFVTFRCADALPQEKLKQWQQELAQWHAVHPEPHDEATRQEFYERFPKRMQTWLDAGYGECLFRQPAMREIVESALRHFDGQRYRLAEFVVAANHVHALVTPLGEHLLSNILHSWKSFTGNKINEVRGRSGTFWQKETFDHIVRSPASLAKFREYIKAHGVQSLEGSSTVAVNVAAASSRNPKEEERLEAAATMKLRAGMERLYRLFQKAAVLGSLINPRAQEGDLLVADFHELQPLLEKALKVEEASSLSKNKDQSLEGSATMHEMAVTARGLAKAAEILAGQFTLVATNVPYLGRGKQDDVLKEYCERVYPEAKADLATCFVERCLDFCATGNGIALVTPQNWLFLGSYRGLRQRLVRELNWNYVARLGPGAFETIGGEVVNIALLAIAAQRPVLNHTFIGIDVSNSESPFKKAAGLCGEALSVVTQRGQLQNPDAVVTFEEPSLLPILERFAVAPNGSHGGDSLCHRRMFWEFAQASTEWRFLQGTVDTTCSYGGREQVFSWFNSGEQHRENPNARIQGDNVWQKSGIVVSLMQKLPASLYSGEMFDIMCTPIVPHDPRHLAALWAFCSSPDYSVAVRKIDQKLNVTNATLAKVPFDLAHWQKVAAEKYPHGLPKPFSRDPTQWLFNGHPKGAGRRDTSPRPSPQSGEGEDTAALQVAVARLLGYQWPRQTGSSFPDCPALAPDGLEKHADKDGVVCFSQVRDEAPAATRLRALLADAFNVAAASSRSSDLRQDAAATMWSHEMERKLIAATGSKADSLEDWLLNDFFTQHCDLFHSRPFIWHIWDGRKDGFNVLVNYHQLCGSGFQPLGFEAGSLSHLGHRTLETLTHAYLGDWITRQKDAVARGVAGADDCLAAALELQGELKNIVAGEPPYDLFIRWKTLACQPNGWQPDINDGVRLNIRPFLVKDLSRSKKGCGLFRSKPGSSLKWEKDRGKEPARPKADFPWFWSWDEKTVDFKGNGEFDGNRWNDCHYRTEFKRAARERKK